VLSLRLAAVILAWLATLSVVAWLVVAGREVALDRGERSTSAFAALVEHKTAGNLESVRLTLAAIGDAYQLQPPPAKHDAKFQRMLTRRLHDLTSTRALFIIGRDGRLVHDTDHPATPEVSLADRPYFRAYLEDDAQPYWIWPPVDCRSGTGWFLPVTQPLGRAAAFEGVVVAAVQADYFARQYRSVSLGDDYLVALFYVDGTLIASHPPAGDVGTRYASLPIFAEHSAQGSGTFWTRRSLVPGERVVSFRAVPELPLVVHVSRGKKDILASWRRTATGAGIAMGLLTLFIVWLIARLARDRARRERLRERRMQAEKLEALGQFTGGIAHDFANMLGIVALNTAVLRESAGDAAARQQALGVIDRTVQGGLKVVDRLLSFARRKPLAVAPMCLSAWLEAARAFLSQAAGPRVTVDIEAPGELPRVLCDSDALDMAVVNLVINARDAMAGAGRIGIRCFVCEDEGELPRPVKAKPETFVCIAVQDIGPGMTDEVRRRALEPFYTTKGKAGTGLGLPQVYGFVRQLGGYLTIDPAPGGGTVVHLYLPIVPAEKAP
jgi:two-component system NtrC family sensor kinase